MTDWPMRPPLKRGEACLVSTALTRKRKRGEPLPPVRLIFWDGEHEPWDRRRLRRKFNLTSCVNVLRADRLRQLLQNMERRRA